MLGPTEHQVLVGLMISGPYVWCPHYRADSLAFYRKLAADGLVVEADAGEGRCEFTIAAKGERMAQEESERLRRNEDADGASREIDALISAGDVGAAERWFEANRERRVRSRDALRLFQWIRGADPGSQ